MITQALPQVFTTTQRPQPNTSEAGVISWVFRNLQSLQRTGPGLYIAPWANADIQSISYRLAQMGVSILDFSRSSRIGQVDVDATQAAQDATDAAIESGIGMVYYPPGGQYLMTDSIMNTTSVTHFTLSKPLSGSGATVQGSAVIVHDFVGPQFVFNGADGNVPGSGGGIYNLQIANIHGAPGDPCGSAVLFTAVDVNHRASNSSLDGLVIADGAGGPYGAFTYAIEFDFANSIGSYGICGSADMFISNVLTHTSGTAAIRASGLATSQFTNCKFFDSPGSDVIVGDVDPCLEIAFNNCYLGTLTLNDVGSITAFGGIFNAITNTSSSTRDQSTLFPGKLATPFVDNSSGLMNVVYFDGTNALVTNAGMRIQGAVATYSGSGAPSGLLGVDGDWYQRFDTPGTALQRLYVKDSGSWTGVV